jgi:uncharacterized integral membrane protein
VSQSPSDRTSSEPHVARVEGRRDRAARYARHGRLYTWAAILAAALALFIILIAENTRKVKVGWIFGYTHTSLVYLVLVSALVGWLAGIATSIVFRRRTRRPSSRL